MPLLPFSRCDVPAPAGDCDFLFATAERLLEAAASGLTPYLPPSACGDTFETYVSMNPPIAEWYDALSIHLVTYGAQPTRGQAPEFGVWAPQVAEWDMRLWENAYPVMVDDKVPPASLYNAVNAHVYAHGMAFRDALIAAKMGDTLNLPAQIGETVIGALTPLGGSGSSAGAVGWQVKITTKVGAP